ncbi:hypothetical protein DMENIID0001_025990 [Sergentomyia squamirostris]
MDAHVEQLKVVMENLISDFKDAKKEYEDDAKAVNAKIIMLLTSLPEMAYKDSYKKTVKKTLEHQQRILKELL